MSKLRQDASQANLNLKTSFFKRGGEQSTLSDSAICRILVPHFCFGAPREQKKNRFGIIGADALSLLSARLTVAENYTSFFIPLSILDSRDGCKYNT